MDKTTRKAPSFETASSIILQNAKTRLIKALGLFREQNPIITHFELDGQSHVRFNDKNETWTENSHNPHNVRTNNLPHADLAGFLLARGGRWDYEEPGEDFIALEAGYDFSHLMPDCALIKDSIEAFCERTDPVKFSALHGEISSLKSQISLLQSENSTLREVFHPAHSAKARIHAHLAYKLGAAMLRHSKNFTGWLKMPIIALTLAHKEACNKIPSPPLEAYPDYAQALREQEGLTYRLGAALILAHKNWHRGGYVKFWLQVWRLRREFKALGREILAAERGRAQKMSGGQALRGGI